LSVSNESYGHATSLDNIKSKVIPGGSAETESGITAEDPSLELLTDKTVDHTDKTPASSTASGRRANAAFVVLARNGDLNGIVPSIKQMEDRFNKKYNYPYVFLNDKPFDDKFKAYVDLYISLSLHIPLNVMQSHIGAYGRQS
jgi:alpha 1,2-mannosyltransferase